MCWKGDPFPTINTDTFHTSMAFFFSFFYQISFIELGVMTRAFNPTTREKEQKQEDL